MGSAVGNAAGSILGNSFAEAMRDGAAWMIKTTIGWWLEVPAIDLTTSPVGEIRGYVQWLALVVAIVGVSWQSIMLMLTRRPEPLFNIGRGMFYLVLWTSVGIVGPAAALRAGDSFSTWALNKAASGQAADRLIDLASLKSVSSTGAVIILGLLMMIAGLVQAVLMLFREGAVILLAGVVVLAAAGSFTNATRPWLPKVVGWMLALIVYKPAAALVYAAALTLTGDGDDPRTVVVGLTMMLMAIVALPVLMKFFTWTTGAATGGGGGGIAALAAGGAAAIHARAAADSGAGGSAGMQASNLRTDLGPAAGAPPTGASPAPQAAAPSAGSTAGSTAGATSGASSAAGAAGGAAGAAVAVVGAARTGGRAAASRMVERPD